MAVLRLQRSDLQQLREQIAAHPLRAEHYFMSTEDAADLGMWAAELGVQVGTNRATPKRYRPYQLGEACRLNATVTIDDVINARSDRPARTYYIDWEPRRKRVEVVRSRGWTKRNSRRLWAEALERGDDPEEFLVYAVEGTRPGDDY